MLTAAPANKGRFSTEDAALNAVVERLVTSFDPQSIWLFGSRARDEARPDSDFDLLVVAKPDGAFGSDDYEALDRQVSDLRVGCDIVPCAASDFEAGQQAPTSFVAQIVRDGCELYSARRR